MTSSGGVPSSSVIMENWLTSINCVRGENGTVSVLTVFPGEQWFAFEHLREYTTCAPNVDGDIVLLPGQHNLRRTVISRRNVACHLGVLDPR